MSFDIGVVCGRCDRYNAIGTATCACGRTLALAGRNPEAPAVESSPVDTGSPATPFSVFATDDLRLRRPPSASRAKAVVSTGDPPRETGLSSSRAFEAQAPVEARGAPARRELSLEELMEQAKNYVCRSCSTPVPLGHKFCGRCGAAIPPDIANARTQFFGQLQMPGKAKLILIRGDGVEGLSYQLNAEQHIVGRNGQLVFPDDPFVSPRHANLFYRGGRLVVRDEGSTNGVFLRIRGTVEVSPGDFFLAGEQLFRVDGAPRPNDGPAPDGTYFYSSPKHQTSFKVTQFLQGSAAAMAVCARANGVQIGREGSDLNFPADLYMSATHCRLENGARLTLTDLNSRNGTYVRLKADKELSHGDYLFIGRKLLRVEIIAN
jgi:pSer/pThr/pTyr-binding forkhead associated (FHA) protein